jgi:hypothetical protein
MIINYYYFIINYFNLIHINKYYYHLNHYHMMMNLNHIIVFIFYLNCFLLNYYSNNYYIDYLNQKNIVIISLFLVSIHASPLQTYLYNKLYELLNYSILEIIKFI